MEEALIKRILPHSIEAEQSVLGCMIMSRDAVMTASEILQGDDFYQHQHKVVFESVVELFNEGKPVDPVILQNRLKEKDVPAEISSTEFIRDLFASVPVSVNVKHYAMIVKDKSRLRKMIKLNEEVANSCYLSQDKVNELMDDIEKQMFALLQERNSDSFTPINDVVMEALETIERASKIKGNVTGLASGFRDLDYKTAGFQNSDFILIAARPSMGKTALVLNMAQHMAFKDNRSVAVFSLEMSKEQLVNRLFSLESGVNSQKIRTGDLKDEEWGRLVEGAGVVGNSKLIIDDTPGIAVTELRSKCRKYKLENDIAVVIIDYLQLMSGRGRSDNRQQEISEISRSLKSLARELNVPVIALSQLSRAVESRPDKRPMLSDLRESGAIEQDADVVMFIYRDDYYNRDTEDQGIAEINIAKQRNGPIGKVELVWLPEYTLFKDSNRDRQERKNNQ